MTYQYRYNRTLVSFSKVNKKNATDAEILLWHYLRNRQLAGYKFRRQYPVHNYILDFYCVEKKFAIELDGSQHREQETYDENRTDQLAAFDIYMIRFWDNEVLENIGGVLEKILRILEKNDDREPHPNPLLTGEGIEEKMV